MQQPFPHKQHKTQTHFIPDFPQFQKERGKKEQACLQERDCHRPSQGTKKPCTRHCPRATDQTRGSGGVGDVSRTAQPAVHRAETRTLSPGPGSPAEAALGGCTAVLSTPRGCLCADRTVLGVLRLRFYCLCPRAPSAQAWVRGEPRSDMRCDGPRALSLLMRRCHHARAGSDADKDPRLRVGFPQPVLLIPAPM